MKINIINNISFTNNANSNNKRKITKLYSGIAIGGYALTSLENYVRNKEFRIIPNIISAVIWAITAFAAIKYENNKKVKAEQTTQQE